MHNGLPLRASKVFCNAAADLVFSSRLENIIIHTEFKRFNGIFKFVVGCQNNRKQPGQVLVYFSKCIQAIDYRHADVHKSNI